MSKREEYEKRVEAYLMPVMEKNQFELVDVEYVKEAGTWYLRAYIDKEADLPWTTASWFPDSWENGWTGRILSTTAIFSRSALLALETLKEGKGF